MKKGISKNVSVFSVLLWMRCFPFRKTTVLRIATIFLGGFFALNLQADNSQENTVQQQKEKTSGRKTPTAIPGRIQPIPLPFVPFEFLPGRRDPFISPYSTSVYVTERPKISQKAIENFETLFPKLKAMLESQLKLVGISTSKTPGSISSFALVDLKNWNPVFEDTEKESSSNSSPIGLLPLRPQPVKTAPSVPSSVERGGIKIFSKETGLRLPFPAASIEQLKVFSSILVAKNSKPLQYSKSDGTIIFPIRSIDEKGIVIGFPNIPSPVVVLPLPPADKVDTKYLD